MSYTKGKWETKQTRGNNRHEYTLFVGDSRNIIANIEFVDDKGFADDCAEKQANARLIAAAPQLLEALEDLLEQAEDANNKQHAGIPICADIWSAMYSAQNQAKAALAAAKG